MKWSFLRAFWPFLVSASFVAIFAVALPFTAMAEERARRCEDSLAPAQSVFRPSYQLALIRSNYATNLPENLLGYEIWPTSDFRQRIKGIGYNLNNQSPSAVAVARSNLLYLMRFGQTVEIRKAAFVELSQSSEFRHLVDQFITARLYEPDPDFRQWLSETVERLIPEHETYRKNNWTPMPREWLDEMNLSPYAKQRIWESVERGYSYRNPLEIRARVEQIPAEIEWLERLRTHATNSVSAQHAYRQAVAEVKTRRRELADMLFDDMIFELYRHRNVDFLVFEPTSEKLNVEKFPKYHPPFTPDRPYIFVRVRAGQSIELARTYGGEAALGGAFFFPSRPNYMKSSLEARDTGALPDKNTTEFWRKVEFGEGEEFYVGAINPQILPNGQSIPDFGRGGLGGEIQFWRDPVMLKDGQYVKKPYFSEGQVGTEVPTIQNPELQKAQQMLREQVGTSEPRHWYQAKEIYKKVLAVADPADATLASDLKKMDAELWRFHYLIFVKQMNAALTLLTLPQFEREYFKPKGMYLRDDFTHRDHDEYGVIRKPNWVRNYMFADQVLAEYNKKVDEYYATGKTPDPIRPPPIPMQNIPNRPLDAEERAYLDRFVKGER